MQWLGFVRQWRPVLAWWSLVGLAAACGGGHDGGATGPGGDVGQLAGDYQLVGANDGEIPTTVTWNGCSPIQVQNGGITLNADGHWQMQFNWQDQNGQPQYTGDHGRFQVADGQLQFSSEAWGDHFEGEIDDGVVWLYYDFCGDDPGEDLDLAFAP
jgi:hypothetical protein